MPGTFPSATTELRSSTAFLPGICAALESAGAAQTQRLRRTGRKVRVSLPGGDLTIEWRETDDHVLMTGPVEYEYAGTFDPALFAAAGAA